MTDVDRMDPVQALRALSTIVLADHSFEAVLQRTSEIAQDTIPGAHDVSVTMHDGAPKTVASTGMLATLVDETQYQEDEGPCLQAMRSGRTVVVEDQTTEDRWPGYDPRAVAAGVRSSCSVPMQVNGDFIGALNAYGIQTHAFDETAVTVAQDLA